MIFARLTEKKQGLKGFTPNGWPVVATFDQWSYLEVAWATDSIVVLRSPVDHSEFKTSWKGIKILPRGWEL